MTPMVDSMNPKFLMMINMALCAGVVYIGVCRLSALDKTIAMRVRMTYTLMVVSATMSMIQFWAWGTHPTPAELGFATATLGFLVLGSRRWRHGAPKEFVTDFSKPDF
jgi:hypothetical protein